MRSAKRNVAELISELRAAIESRIFCSTGSGGGVDSSCSPKDAGGGGKSGGVNASNVGKKSFADGKDEKGNPTFGGYRIQGIPSLSPERDAVRKGQVYGNEKPPRPGRKYTQDDMDMLFTRPYTGEKVKVGKKSYELELPAFLEKVKNWGPVSPGFVKRAKEVQAFIDSVAGGKVKGGGKKKRSAEPAVESRALSVERRSFAIEAEGAGEPLLRIESRCECDDAGAETKREYIVGYAAKFGVNSLNLGKFTERIAPNAFRLVTERRGRKKSLETRALFNHNADLPLAKFPGTLKLSVDDVGLRYEFPVPDTSYGRDLASNIRSGIVTGSSFSFTVPKDGEEWTMEEGRSIRTVTRVDSLIDVGPVTYPAYPDTDAAVAQRSYEMFIKKNESRIFCSTGAGGGVDSSCSPKDAGGGGSGGGGGGDSSASGKAASKAMPGGPSTKVTAEGNVKWSKKGGYAGKKVIDKTVEKLKSQGFKKSDSSDTSTQSTTGGQVTYKHPDGHEFTHSTSYGSTKSDNYYYMEMKPAKGAGSDKVGKKEYDEFEKAQSKLEGAAPKTWGAPKKNLYPSDKGKTYKSDKAKAKSKAKAIASEDKAQKKADDAAKKAYDEWEKKQSKFEGSPIPGGKGKGKRSLFVNREQAVKQAKLLRRSVTRLAAAEIRAVLKKHGR